MSEFVSALENNIKNSLPNISITENGAVGLKTTGKNLLDLNFMLSSLRSADEETIWNRFVLAYNDDPVLALAWLFFARDIRGGCGERRVFRVIFKRFCSENAEASIKLLQIIPFYGRWDDVVEIAVGDVPCKVRQEALTMIKKQITDDINSAMHKENVSLLAKWMPSLNTTSDKTRRKAETIRSFIGWSPKMYRTTLSFLRKRIRVVEQNMSANEWDEIDYSGVPSRASMIYRGAFKKHDEKRYEEFLESVRSGKEKINAGALFPYDIVHAYSNSFSVFGYNETLEQQWKALPNKVPENGSTLVVVDGSGSMGWTPTGSSVTAHDVARSLAIYFAEKLGEPYKNTFITFSGNPQFVRFMDGLSLREKLLIMLKHSECANTDIEKVFDIILDTAVKNHLKQEEVPANILVLSDMEFDAGVTSTNKILFDQIKERWESAGYKLPRLVFWNICSRTGTIPVSENDLGVALVSGFSPNIADMVMSGCLDPYENLVNKLTDGRYQKVFDALKE